MNWISIKDKLPEFNIGVLVTNGEVVTAAARGDFFKSGEINWMSHGGNGPEFDWDFDERFVTHWMPLPEPPD